MQPFPYFITRADPYNFAVVLLIWSQLSVTTSGLKDPGPVILIWSQQPLVLKTLMTNLLLCLAPVQVFFHKRFWSKMISVICIKDKAVLYGRLMLKRGTSWPPDQGRRQGRICPTDFAILLPSFLENPLYLFGLPNFQSSYPLTHMYLSLQFCPSSAPSTSSAIRLLSTSTDYVY